MPPDAVRAHEYGSGGETVVWSAQSRLTDSVPPPAGPDEAGSVDGA